ncbi:MAG: hypothetical protein ACOC7N_06345 [Chloroflexota bacterium]
MPNTKDRWQTTAAVYDEERATLWRRVFGQPDGDHPEVPIVSLIPILVQVPRHKDLQRAYQLDLNAITTRQRARLVQALAERFGLSATDVAASIDQVGVPILARDVTTRSTDQRLVNGVLF